MKIAIDARFYGTGHTGLGRYTTNVLKYLPNHLPNYTLQVLLRDDQFTSFKAAKNVQKVRADVPHYSLAEQILLPLLLTKLKPDLYYTLHFNAPIALPTPMIVTVHDLIKSHFTGIDTTTRAPWLYGLKRLGYNKVIKHTLNHAKDIIVPTGTVKNDILSMFTDIKPELIHAIPEAPDEIFRRKKIQNNRAYLPQNYLLFVGNAYPHKNLSILLEAIKNTAHELVIIAKPSSFLTHVLASFDQTRIHVLSNLGDAQLMAVYRHAQVLVTPSLMEGYGLVGLEALMVGTPVIASNIPVYREVYGDKVTYFDPHSVKDLRAALQSVMASPRKRPLTLSRTWDDVARDIAEVIHARCTYL